jgi:VWFA-related protein
MTSPRRTLLPLAALLLAGVPAAAAEPPATPSFGEAMEVHVVNVDVYVTDRNGHRITGLKRDDFMVVEDGKPVGVTNFEELAPRSAPTAQRETPATPPPAERRQEAAAKTQGTAGIDPERQLSLVVFVDSLHIHPQNRTRVVEQIRKFLTQRARPGDRVLVATYDNNLRVRRPFTDDATAVDASLHAIESLPTYGQDADNARQLAFRTMLDLHSMNKCGAEMIKPVEEYAEQARGDALRTVGALTVMINSLSGVPGHKALLFVSDGISITPGEELFQAANDLCSGSAATGISTKDDSREPGSGSLQGPRFDPGSGSSAVEDPLKYQPSQAALDSQKYSVAKRFEDLAAHASANRVTFYTLQASGLQGLSGADASNDGADRVLQSGLIQQIETSNLKGSLTALAIDTGGQAMLDVNDFLPELARMQEDFESYYSLGYTPNHTGDGRDHHVEVKVKRAGARVRYRQSYRDKPVLEKMADRTLAALFHGIEDNPLAVTIEIGDTAPADHGEYAVPVRLRIPLFKLAILNKDNTYQGKLRLMVATRDEAGGASSVRQVEVPLNIPRKEVLNAMGQYYVYTLTLHMKPGEQHVAVAVHDEVAATTSYLTRPVAVGAAVAAANR